MATRACWSLKTQNAPKQKEESLLPNMFLYKYSLHRSMSTHASQLSIDPASPFSVPECRFLGADSLIQPLKHKININLQRWDTKQQVLANLQNVLETEFPTKLAVESLDLKAECGICYSYKLDDNLPDIVCDGHGCEKVLTAQLS